MSEPARTDASAPRYRWVVIAQLWLHQVLTLAAVAAAALAWIVLDEPLSLMQTWGGALILLGIFVARPKQDPTVDPRPEDSHQPATKPSEHRA